jgi:para-nitrobenzyl esterase
MVSGTLACSEEDYGSDGSLLDAGPNEAGHDETRTPHAGAEPPADGSIPSVPDGSATDGGSGDIADGASSEGGGEPAPAPPECGDAGASGEACVACTHQGWVQGNEGGAGCDYLGVPYATPPVGALRFAPPEPARPWSGVRAATDFGAACAQPIDFSGAAETSEDCLFLNVWTPRAAPAGPLPVMVFIHGGGFIGGGGNTYSGRGLAEVGQVVVVSMNYRLGVLGFFAHPELDRARSDRPSGSDAIRDQQLALRWVRDNIASFQGDPNNVTVFGESAGSSSVCAHLVSPGSRRLAKRFIMESGVCTRGVANGIAAIARERTYATAQQMVESLCPDAADPIACLRDLPAESLMFWGPAESPPAGGLVWAPVIEGPGGVFPVSPDALLERGDQHPGEVIIGTNKNEYVLFQLFDSGPSSLDELRSRLEMAYGGRADELMALYAPGPRADPNQAYVALMTDVMFRCGARALARKLAARGSRVYLYSYEYGTAMHADELLPVFGWDYLPFAFLFSPFPLPEALEDAMQGYWTTFAKSGDPNRHGLPTWPRYDLAGDVHMTLTDAPAPGSGLQRAACDFWDDYLANAP